MSKKNPFITLGVSEQATQSEVYEAYKKQYDKYAGKRYAPGEEGARACEKLDEIEEAYREAEEILKSRITVEGESTPLRFIEELIKDRKIDEAQAALDETLTRTAEWHFLQSMIYYQKGRLRDAEEQLKVAVEMDRYNAKYLDAYERLSAKLKGSHSENSFYRENGNFGEGGQRRSYRNTNAEYGNQRAGGCTPCDCCSSLICADCCCECMGGDLISCC